MVLTPLLGSLRSGLKKKSLENRRRAAAVMESLERRTLLSVNISADGRTADWIDVDGDAVVLKVTKGTLLPESFGSVSEGVGDQVQFLYLDATYTGAALKVTVTQVGGGDGLTQIGSIQASDVNLNCIEVAGDVGEIWVGAVGNVKLNSIGRYGLATQGGDGSIGFYSGGNIGSFTVAGDVTDGFINVSNGNLTARIGTLTIGGSLIGGTAEWSGIAVDRIGTLKIAGDVRGGAAEYSGKITALTIGYIEIGGDVVGGDGSNSASIRMDESFSRLFVRGSVIGGSGASSAEIYSQYAIPRIEIAHDLIGANIVGNSRIGTVVVGGSLVHGATEGDGSISADSLGTVLIGGDIDGGTVSTTRSLRRLDVGGSIIAGAFEYSGVVIVQGRAESINIAGNVVGGTEMFSGSVQCNSSVGAIRIGGSVLGGTGAQSGYVYCFQGGVISITGDVDQGYVQSDALGSLKIGGSLIGGALDSAGYIWGVSDIGSIYIRGSIIGGTGANSGSIVISGSLGSLIVGESIVGGSAYGAGYVVVNETIRSMRVGIDIIGGVSDYCGAIYAGTKLISLSIAGSVVGGAGEHSGEIMCTAIGAVSIGGNLKGGIGYSAGGIFANEDIGRIKIGGDFRGADLVDGPIYTELNGAIRATNIGNIVIAGSIISGVDETDLAEASFNATIRVHENIGSLKVGGSILGHNTAWGYSPVVITAQGYKPGAVAIGSISVGGNVEYAMILGGYDMETYPAFSESHAVNGGARIGSVVVGADWIASSVVAGAKDPNGDGFGTENDVAVDSTIKAQIASIVIKGTATGTDAADDHFGILSARICAVSIGGVPMALKAGGSNDVKELAGITGDFTLREV